MPTFNRITEAREKSKRIREFNFSFKRERIEHQETQRDIRFVLQSSSATAYLAQQSESEAA